jgi:hypothetical protein
MGGSGVASIPALPQNRQDLTQIGLLRARAGTPRTPYKEAFLGSFQKRMAFFLPKENP